ncbi:MAG: ribosome recycling factor [Actinobacteria bacterium]|nr:ribosome recycling factor [Actinomycetota bacterium]MCL5883061.1 ribosome recycling factor [Actinomycetota bacterium]
MVEEFLEDGRDRMDKAVVACHNEFNTIRTGRASTALLDRISVDYYGTRTPLKQLANLSAPEPRLLVITPYDKSAMKEIEHAIMESELGLNPNNDGNVIRLSIPELTEERRRDLVKVVKGLAENGRVAVRNIRRHVLHDLEELQKEGEISEDELRRTKDELQKLTDKHTEKIDQMLVHKEGEILEV